MGRRSLFASLDFSTAKSSSFVKSQRDAPSDYIQFDLLTYIPPSVTPLPVRVAVVGGGFAGLAAATTLQNLRAQVTLYEAQTHFGGRVSSIPTAGRTPPPRILEAGAELIGRNHHAWVRIAKDLGLGLSVVTTDDLYEGMDLQPRLRLGGKDLTPAEMKSLGGDMQKVLSKLVLLAETAYGVPLRPPPPPSSASFKPFEPWYEPWKFPWLKQYDTKSLGTWINDNTSSNPRSRAAIRYGFANDMAIDVDNLSLLAMLTHIAGGGFGRYWDDTEVYRCEDGNQALAARLERRLWESCPLATIRGSEVVTAIATTPTEVTVTSRRADAGNAATQDTKFDYLVLAVPSTVWSDICLGGAWQLPQPMQSGAAVKYLAIGVDSRYWIQRGYAPSGDDDQFGQLWESTDNQMGGANIGLTVFAGGPNAATALKQNSDDYFLKGMEKLLPGARTSVKQGLFVPWPNLPHIKTGYCAPGLGQVTGVQQQMQGAFGVGGQVFLAGEEVSAPFFGFMEGALQSGIKAAERVCNAAKISLPAAPKATPTSQTSVRRKCREMRIA